MARRPMGSLEAAVLKVLWDSDDALKPGEVRERIDLEPGVTYSTVLTILGRLLHKGLVTRAKDGKAYRYRSTNSREEQVAHAMAEAFAAADDHGAALGHFVDRLSVDETSTLRRILDRRR